MQDKMSGLMRSGALFLRNVPVTSTGRAQPFRSRAKTTSLVQQLPSGPHQTKVNTLAFEMCGRYSLSVTSKLLAQVFKTSSVVDWSPRYNIAPTQSVPVIRAGKESGDRRLDLLHWGLVPSWTKDIREAHKPINARSESIDKGMFKNTFLKRRCLVPTNGFYEWMKIDKAKQPYFIQMRDGRPFAFAGLWEYWKSEGHEPIVSFTILTTDSNDVASPIHNRMPAIIPEDQYDAWLDPTNQDPEALRKLLSPYQSNQMTAYPVSRRVNSPDIDSPACIQPVELEPPKSLFSS